MSGEDYRRVEQMLVYLEAHFREQPSLGEVARAAYLSEYHCQRLFKRWAGISPKRFLQFLTVEYAKGLLEQSRSLLDVTYEAGLSGPGRLHDLFVTVEAVTPGEFKRGGHGLTIRYGVHETQFGDCLLAITDRGICGLYFLQGGSQAALAELEGKWPEARLCEDAAATEPIAERVFSRTDASQARPLNLLLRGSNFQIQVWQALLRIPSGHVLAYEDVARWVGKPNASRAVGQAVGSNPISYIIPCHRIIRKSGIIGNYGGGRARKIAILGWEAAQRAGGAND